MRGAENLIIVEFTILKILTAIIVVKLIFLDASKKKSKERIATFTLDRFGQIVKNKFH